MGGKLFRAESTDRKAEGQSEKCGRDVLYTRAKGAGRAAWGLPCGKQSVFYSEGMERHLEGFKDGCDLGHT